MHPELFTLPFTDVTVKTYGFFMMLGFLSGVWLAMRRASRVKQDPDTVLNLCFLILLFGVGGARAFYVIHYWQSTFAGKGLKEILDLRSGGLEFLGGFLGAALAVSGYLVYRNWRSRRNPKAHQPVSLRVYMDILIPSLAWGMAFGRIGCFFNGCCFGGPCVDPYQARANSEPTIAWAVSFPLGSGAYQRQWEERQISVPAELLVTGPTYYEPFLVSAAALSMSVEKREKYTNLVAARREQYQQALQNGNDPARVAELKKAWEELEQAAVAHDISGFVYPIREIQQYPSRSNPDRRTSFSELAQLAASTHSLPVHPTQLYSAVHSILLSLLLSAVFYARKRHGVVFGLFLLLYPIVRIILETIRVDNPHHAGGLTASQWVSVLVFACGVVYMIVIYKVLPQRSRRAVAFVPPEDPDATLG